MAESIEIDDFSGGITDLGKKPSKRNQYEIADNLLISDDRGLISRPGLVCWNESDPFIKNGSSVVQTVLGVYELEGYLIAFCEDRYFYYTKVDKSTVWTRIQGPVNDNTVSPYPCRIVVSKWNGHLIITVDPNDKSAIGYFPDPVGDPPEYKRVPPRKIFIQANRALTTPFDIAGVPVIRTLQLPLPKNINLVDNGSGAFRYSYKIGFAYRYFAVINGEILEFLDLGPYEIHEAIMTAAITGSNELTIEWSKLKNNSFGYNAGGSFTDFELWDAPNISMYFSRTENVSDIFYELTNGLFGITNDNNEGAADADDGDYDDGNVDGVAGIAGYPTSYDEDGSLMIVPVTSGPYYHTVVGDKAWYLNDLQGQTRLLQSFSGNPSSTNPSLFTTFDEPGIGLSNFNGNPIVFTNGFAYRVDGVFDEFGGGRLISKLISDRFGCISHYTIMKTEIGVFYFSNTGICFTNGISALKVSNHLNKSYLSWVKTQAQIDKIYGVYANTQNKVYWFIEEPNGDTFFLVLDLKYGVTEECSFSKIKFSSLLDIRSIFVHPDNDDVLLSSEEFILEMDGEARDDVIPNNDMPVVWKTSPILYEFKTVAYNMGSSLLTKRSEFVLFNLKDSDDFTGLSCRPLGYNDREPNPRYLDSCFFYQRMHEYGELVGQEYGNPDPQWNNTQVIPFKRHFHGDSLRYIYKQFGLKNLPVSIHFSSEYEDGVFEETVGSTSLTLPNTTSLAVPDSDDTSWYMYTSLDEYEVPIPVISVTITTETVFALEVNSEITSGTLTIEGVKWKLARIRKNEIFYLLALGMPFDVIGDQRHETYRVGGGSNNGG